MERAEYVFSTWFAENLSEDITNILLTARSEGEVTRKVKEQFLLQKYFEKEIAEKIEGALKAYNDEDNIYKNCS